MSTSCLLFVYFRSPGVGSIESSKRVNKELFEKSDFHSHKNTQTNTKIKLADSCELTWLSQIVMLCLHRKPFIESVLGSFTLVYDVYSCLQIVFVWLLADKVCLNIVYYNIPLLGLQQYTFAEETNI